MAAIARPLLFGEVLHDCFPDGSRVLGGAPLNVAWHLRALGLDPYVVSRVGDDAAGRAVRQAMRDWALDPAGIQIDPERPTGQVAVRIDDGEPRFDILADQAYDRIEPLAEPPHDIGLLYHGTLAVRHPGSRTALARLREAIAAPVFVDVNLRDPWWDLPTVAEALDVARWCKLNADELARLAGPGDPTRAAARLIARHGLEQVFVTLGAAGAFALGSGGDLYCVAPTDDIAVIDTVGAGDAFAATVIAGLLGDWPVASTLQRAQRLASAVCGLRGALSRDAGFYRDVLARWNEARHTGDDPGTSAA
jgi:fructokinase